MQPALSVPNFLRPPGAGCGRLVLCVQAWVRLLRRGWPPGAGRNLDLFKALASTLAGEVISAEDVYTDPCCRALVRKPGMP